jgi:hypothetical protein
MWTRVWLVLVVVVVPSMAVADCPSLDAIQRRAEAFAGLDHAPRWGARARWSAVVPVISARATTDTSWEEGSAASRAAVGPVERQQAFDVRLTWRLERLVFNPDEPRLFESERRARRDRIALRQEVATAYYRWRRVAAQAGTADGALAAAEAFAQVDAFTGGWLARGDCR